MANTKVHKTLHKSLFDSGSAHLLLRVIPFQAVLSAFPLALHREACALTLQTMSTKRCLTDQDGAERNRKSSGIVSQRVVLGLGLRGRQGLHASHRSLLFRPFCLLHRI